MRETRRGGPAAVAIVAIGAAVLHAQWSDIRAPGVPRLPNGAPNLNAPPPRAAGGTPDLSGVWVAECPFMISDCWDQSLFFDLARDLPAGAVQMTPWAAAIQARREGRDHVDDPLGYCLPPGVPRILFYRPFKILQTPGLTAFLHETDVGPMFRQIFTDGRSLPAAPEPTWLGYSVGRWDGDTLVVETAGFRDGGWLDTREGHPHSDALHVTERFRRTTVGTIALSVTIEDGKAYTRPWTVNTALHLRPDLELLEAFCDSHQKTMEHRRIDPAPPEPHSPQ